MAHFGMYKTHCPLKAGYLSEYKRNVVHTLNICCRERDAFTACAQNTFSVWEEAPKYLTQQERIQVHIHFHSVCICI